MFGLFGGDDWNVLAVIFERRDLYQVSGQRAKGAAAKRARDGAKAHPRTVYYIVFNQKGAFLEGGPGSGEHQVPGEVLKQLERELPKNRTILDMLKSLETKESTKLAKPLVWTGYPRREMYGQDTQT